MDLHNFWSGKSHEKSVLKKRDTLLLATFHSVFRHTPGLGASWVVFELNNALWIMMLLDKGIVIWHWKSFRFVSIKCVVVSLCRCHRQCWLSRVHGSWSCFSTDRQEVASSWHECCGDKIWPVEEAEQHAHRRPGQLPEMSCGNVTPQQCPTRWWWTGEPFWHRKWGYCGVRFIRDKICILFSRYTSMLKWFVPKFFYGHDRFGWVPQKIVHQKILLKLRLPVSCETFWSCPSMPDVMCMLKLAPTITSTSHGSVDDFMKQQLLSGTIAIAGVVFNVYVYVCVCVCHQS